jgi:hypothetical protein
MNILNNFQSIIGALYTSIAGQTINVGRSLPQTVNGEGESSDSYDSPLPFPLRLLPGPWGGRSHQSAALVRAQRVGLPSEDLRPPSAMWPGRASLVLATFAETKVARLPGRNPATLEHANHSS